MSTEERDRTPENWVRPRVLVVDGEDSEASRIARFLEGEGFEVTVQRDGERGFNVLDEKAPDALICEIHTERIDGLRLLQVARLRNPGICVVLIAKPTEIDLAARAMMDGAFDYQTRPLNLEKTLAVIRRAQSVQKLIAQVNDLNRRLDRKFGLHNIIGNSAAISAVLAKIQQIGPTEATVLISGETGTGKELLATALHQNSGRRHGPMIKLHCGDLSDGLVESELFGHEKGAFTGAVASRKGRFELAHGGTLLLDEVGALHPGTQAKLLRVLQEREFMKVGGDRPIKVDVRLIAATNQDLPALVRAGRFREDLYYRLNVVSIEMPALRHRPQDIPLLVDHFLREAAESAGKRIPGLMPRAMNQLVRYAWPGNVRELKNTVTGVVIAAEGDRPLDVSDLPPHFHRDSEESSGIWVPSGSSWAEAERRIIEAALTSTDFDRQRAAEVLGISLRTLYRRINQYKLDDKSKHEVILINGHERF